MNAPTPKRAREGDVSLLSGTDGASRPRSRPSPRTSQGRPERLDVAKLRAVLREADEPTLFDIPSNVPPQNPSAGREGAGRGDRGSISGGNGLIPWVAPAFFRARVSAFRGFGWVATGDPAETDRVWTPPRRTPGFQAAFRREVFGLAALADADLAQRVLSHPRQLAAAARHEAGHVIVGLAVGIDIVGVKVAPDGAGLTFFERPSLRRAGAVEATAFAVAGAMAEGADCSPSPIDRGIASRARQHALREDKALPVEHDRQARQLARRVLTLNRPAVGLIAALLAEYRTLTEHEVGEAMMLLHAVRKPDDHPPAQTRRTPPATTPPHRTSPMAARSVRYVPLPNVDEMPDDFPLF